MNKLKRRVGETLDSFERRAKKKADETAAAAALQAARVANAPLPTRTGARTDATDLVNDLLKNEDGAQQQDNRKKWTYPRKNVSSRTSAKDSSFDEENRAAMAQAQRVEAQIHKCVYRGWWSCSPALISVDRHMETIRANLTEPVPF